ncbi:GFA family protein [Pelagibius sp.]|uniref:GFA family protein n=1 Tax=Pelagibius sp. TaxID=1931238 RepID=UPI00262CD80B|nr:GFA family protein [Pelagibius sp.]
MSDDSKATGRCLCGAVKITIPGGQREVGACHCSMCRRWTGGPILAFDAGRDLAIEGEERIGVYRSSDWAERAFCKTCGSNLFYRLVGSGEHHLCAGLFDDQDGFTLETQIFIDEKPEFYAFANETKDMTGPEVFALYAPPPDEG